MVFPFEFPALEHWEGSRTRLLSLGLGLVERGVEVHVLSKRDPAYGGGEFRGLGLHSFPPYSARKGGKVAGALLAGRSVQSACEDRRFDVVHSHMPVVSASVALWKRLVQSRTLYDTHDWFKVRDEAYHNFQFTPRGLGCALDRLEREIARPHDGVVVTTRLLLERLPRGKRAFVVPNPVDTDHFKPGDSRSRKSRLGDPGLVVGFLGFVSIHQGFWALLDALKEISERTKGAKLLAIGGGFIQSAKAYAKRQGIDDRVVFTGPGRVPYEELPDLINAMDVAVSPLQPEPRYHEYAQPLKVLEYMACGVPTVVTPLPEQSRMVSEAGGGVVARGFGGRELAEAIMECIDTSGVGGRRVTLRAYAVAHHSMQRVIPSLISAYREVSGR